MKLPNLGEPAEVLAICCVAYGMAFPSLTAVCALGIIVLYALGCRLIAYRQAEDVSTLVARVAKAEEDSKKALTIATAQGRAKAQGF